jgi:hypothetical protein
VSTPPSAQRHGREEVLGPILHDGAIARAAAGAVERARRAQGADPARRSTQAKEPAA